MAEQSVVEKMSGLQVDEGKKVMFQFCYRLHLRHASQLAASLACSQMHAVI